jgi:SAM-dependent methyltransferase
MNLTGALRTLFVREPADDMAVPESSPETPRSYASAAERIKATGRFEIEDIELLRRTFEQFDFTPGTPWDDFRNSFFSLPEWFHFGLDPLSGDYNVQQLRLWSVLADVDRAYDPQIDEEAAERFEDAIRFPGYFIRRDPFAVEHAAEHIVATGMIMKHGGAKPGQWALEYGAGFGQTALQLARLGVNVDTVDIDEAFCQQVKSQATFFGVPLTPFHGRFGWNPREGRKYDLIWFYQSFHHCLDFKNVVHLLKQHLSPTGTVLLAGEPITRREDQAVPYPWGLRLHSEVVAVIRQRRWLELGFTEDFLVSLFTTAGFSAERMECDASSFGEGYVFRHRGSRIAMGKHWMPLVESETWHAPEEAGRWTTTESRLTLDSTDSFSALMIGATNHHPLRQVVSMIYGGNVVHATFEPGEHKVLRIDAATKAPTLLLRAKPLIPSQDYSTTSADNRALGIFVNDIRYA